MEESIKKLIKSIYFQREFDYFRKKSNTKIDALDELLSILKKETTRNITVEDVSGTPSVRIYLSTEPYKEDNVCLIIKQ
ncbi:hypothetical protein E4665_16565 [Sporolactobacillus shoreae]|uniref:Uncharacterized protein n=1 Tax=Sporolactobacillus shoreae TaxID=1465501 RepID=A0A4Z0GJF1_9BACL|nr:hypothetical protein [Sporolactobacillus shoreae]TGA96121.1 hypothetical protein E4665_16565 [Sporolactobacillus shoreae]